MSALPTIEPIDLRIVCPPTADQRRQFPTRCAYPEEIRKKDPDRAHKLAMYLTQGDPLADDLVAVFSQLPPGQGGKMLDLVLDQGIDAVPQAPQALREFYAHVADLPLWLDWDLLDLGCRSYTRCGFVGGIVLACTALPLAYRSASASKPLVFSREFEQRAIRRLSETNRFFFEVCKPGGMRRHQPGWKLTIKVRLMHAQMRRLLRQARTKPWRDDLWGAPINQADMGVATLLFCVCQLEHLRRVGFHFSLAESEGVMHLWRYAGYLLGLAPEMLCGTEAEGRHLLDLLLKAYDAPDEGSVGLTRGLMEHAMPMLLGAILPWLLPAGHEPGGVGRAKRGPVVRFCGGLLRRLGFHVQPSVFRRQLIRFCYGLSQGILGNELVAGLNYPATTWRRTARGLLRAVVAPAELCRRLLPGGTTLAYRIGRRQMERLMHIRVFINNPMFRPLAAAGQDKRALKLYVGEPANGR